VFSDAELFLLEQYDRLGTRCDQMSSLGDRFVGLYLTLSIAVVGLGVKHLSHAGLAIVPLVWGSVTLILIRTYKEVFVLGGARRAIEEVLCERNIVSLCGATISALNADENSFRSSLVEIRRSNYFAEPAIGETSVVRQDIDRKIQLRNIRKFLMKFSKF